MPPAYPTTAKRVRMYYDPRGQVVRTVNPDATEQWVVFGRPEAPAAVSLNALKTPVPFAEGQNDPPASGGGGFTPWESFTYDANDLAPITHPSGSGAPASHHYTPKSSLLDPLGRTVMTIDRNGATVAEEVVMQYRFDIRGNLLKVTDALDRTAFTHVYDLKPKSGEGKDEKGANILKTTHIDSGTKTALFDAAYRPIELRDAKGALILHGYDGLNRPTRIWARDNNSEGVTLRQKLIYGDDATDGPTAPDNTNHLGKLYRHFDEAGKVTLEEYDFKGNVLQKKREVIADSEIKAVFTGPPTDWAVPTYRVDWEGTPTLEGEFVTDMEYDGLNRLKRLVYPEDHDSERKELLPFYNNAGALEKVTMDGDTYVEHIAYNAKGQRLLIAFGNEVMTRYAYDPLTFRLSRMRSERYTRTEWTFAYDSGTNRQDIGFDYDLNGNIVRRRERRTDCGITDSQLGADALDRLFEYDALNRLLRATGRESGTQNQNDYLYADAPAPGAPNADNVRAYTRTYAYDRMGNILSLSHSATGNGFSRNFSYGTVVNRLEEIRTGSDDLIEAFTYDANGNQLTAGTTRHHEWDHSDQMRCYYNQTGTSEPTVYAHYLYDAAGNRVKKLVRTSATNWETTVYIDGVFEYQRIETASGIYERNNLHIMDDRSRIAQVRIGSDHDDISDAVTYILDDHLGSSNARLDTSGGVIDREEYFPFGDSSLRTFSKKRYRYVGKEKDAESGLYYYGARYYSAWTCRFIASDPKSNEQPHICPFHYCSNNPLNRIDSDGMKDSKADGGGEPPVKKGDVITGVDGKQYTMSYNEVVVTGSLLDKTESIHADATKPNVSDNISHLNNAQFRVNLFFKQTDAQQIGGLLANRSGLSLNDRKQIMSTWVRLGGDRFQSHPLGSLFVSFIYNAMLTGPVNTLIGGTSRTLGTFIADRTFTGVAGNRMLVSHTFRHWGTSELRFTLGKNVLKYGGKDPGIMQFSTNELTYNSSNVYHRFALDYPGSSAPVGGFPTYNIYSTNLRGFYLRGQAGRMGQSVGGGLQYYRFEKYSSISDPFIIGTTFK